MTTVQFINNLTGTAASQGSASHSHDHSGPAHSHDHGVGEHGHTHEHLEHAGEYVERKEGLMTVSSITTCREIRRT